MLDVNYSYYGYVSAAYRSLQQSTVEVFITKRLTNYDSEGVHHTSFSAGFRPSGWSVRRFMIQKFSSFFKMNLGSSMVLHFFVIF